MFSDLSTISEKDRLTGEYILQRGFKGHLDQFPQVSDGPYSPKYVRGILNIIENAGFFYLETKDKQVTLLRSKGHFDSLMHLIFNEMPPEESHKLLTPEYLLQRGFTEMPGVGKYKRCNLIILHGANCFYIENGGPGTPMYHYKRQLDVLLHMLFADPMPDNQAVTII